MDRPLAGPPAAPVRACRLQSAPWAPPPAPSPCKNERRSEDVCMCAVLLAQPPTPVRRAVFSRRSTRVRIRISVAGASASMQVGPSASAQHAGPSAAQQAANTVCQVSISTEEYTLTPVLVLDDGMNARATRLCSNNSVGSSSHASAAAASSAAASAAASAVASAVASAAASPQHRPTSPSLKRDQPGASGESSSKAAESSISAGSATRRARLEL